MRICCFFRLLEQANDEIIILNKHIIYDKHVMVLLLITAFNKSLNGTVQSNRYI